MELLLWGLVIGVVMLLLLIQVVRLSLRIKILKDLIRELEGYDALHHMGENGDDGGDSEGRG